MKNEAPLYILQNVKSKRYSTGLPSVLQNVIPLISR